VIGGVVDKVGSCTRHVADGETFTIGRTRVHVRRMLRNG
jgi:hypothetical protein